MLFYHNLFLFFFVICKFFQKEIVVFTLYFCFAWGNFILNHTDWNSWVYWVRLVLLCIATKCEWFCVVFSKQKLIYLPSGLNIVFSLVFISFYHFFPVNFVLLSSFYTIAFRLLSQIFILFKFYLFSVQYKTKTKIRNLAANQPYLVKLFERNARKKAKICSE